MNYETIKLSNQHPGEFGTAETSVGMFTKEKNPLKSGDLLKINHCTRFLSAARKNSLSYRHIVTFQVTNSPSTYSSDSIAFISASTAFSFAITSLDRP